MRFQVIDGRREHLIDRTNADSFPVVFDQNRRKSVPGERFSRALRHKTRSSLLIFNSSASG
jgi:hypothetical protein